MIKASYKDWSENHDENFTMENLGKNKPLKKRVATSPPKCDAIKRSAFGDITNASKGKNCVAGFSKDNAGKKTGRKIAVATRKSLRIRKRQQREIEELKEANEEQFLTEKIANVSLSLRSMQQTGTSASCSQKCISNYGVSSLMVGKDGQESGNALVAGKDGHELDDVSDMLMPSKSPTAYYQHDVSLRRREMSYEDLDAENIDNPSETPVYAFIIFEYMRARQHQFIIRKYLSTQKGITAEMRAILVDWMVEVQESFELNHETLYLAVKLVDMYLQDKKTSRDTIQLVGAAAMLIAAKFDERHPPVVDDFLYICDDAYSKKQLLSMERTLLHTVGFDINIPISYRFLRRYAKCSKASVQTLTLARFVLELSLQCYDFVGENDSLLAGAGLWLAFKMNNEGQWTDTLVYYSSHSEFDVMVMAKKLNTMVRESKGKKQQTVWTKYSHSVFHEVANVPLLTEVQFKTEKERIRTRTSHSPQKELSADITEDDTASCPLPL